MPGSSMIKNGPLVKVPGAVFSILIPTWNNLEYLKLCVHSIRKNSFYQHEILVHVNEGKDGSCNWLEREGITYSVSPENVGVCYALNHLADLASTDYILYINDDMYVGYHWDKPLMEAIQSRKDNLFYYSGTMVEYEALGNKAICAPHDFGREVTTFREEEFIEFSKGSHKANWYGSCWPPSIVHREVWIKAGGYDVDYSPGFYSDPDFAMKLWKLGVRDFIGIGTSLVYHFKCKSTGRVVRNNGRKTFARKWGFTSSYLYKNVLKMGEPVEAGKGLTFNKGFAYLASFFKALIIRFS